MTATAPQPPQPHPHGDAAAELMPGLAGPTPARRNHLRPWLVVALAAVGVITAAVPVAIAGLAHHAPIWPAAPADYLTWGTTGDVADDHSLAQAAAAAWQRDNGHDHHEILPLLLQRRSPVGTLAIVQGRDDTGRPRLAILTGVPDDPADPAWSFARTDLWATRAAIRQVSMVTAQLGKRPGRLPEHRGRALMLALAAPGAERWIGTVRRELLDRMVVFGRRHLQSVLIEYVDHYNAHRPHRSLGQRPPLGSASAPAATAGGRVARRDRLGSLIGEYSQAA